MKTLKVLRVSQPIGEFYIGAIPSEDLLEIATVDVREFEKGNPGSIDGIQRELSPNRLKALRTYVNLDYATFPTSIILAVDQRCAEIKEITGCAGLFELIVKDYPGDEDEDAISVENAAFVIDGQHRLAGLDERDKEKSPFEVNVSIFVGADIADQAEIFSRVNLAQTKVNKSLMYDLLDYAKESSPFKTAHDVVVALNRDENGPFYRKIKRLGKTTPGVEGETLAQATVVNGILRHLPHDQEKERSKSILGFLTQAEPREDWKDRIFVDFYRAEDDLSIMLNVGNFFGAVQKKWPQAWNDPQPGQILCRTTGYNALIRFLKDVFVRLAESPRIISLDEYFEVIDRVRIRDEKLTKDEYLPGSAGSGRLYRHLKEQALDHYGNQGSLSF